MAKDLIIRSSTEEFITFKLQEKDKGIQVRYENETLWMTQKAMAELFDVEQPAIAKHLINIYNEKELDKDSTYSKMELVQKEGNRSVKRNVEFYNLDAIISVGYRVNSLRATQFRRWATKILKEYITKGFALNDERFINGNKYDTKYFNELLERREELFNENFKLAESHEFKNDSANNSFTMSPSRWISITNAKGFVSKRGKYDGGTFVHSDIALEFASWIDPAFKLYLI